MANAWKKYSDTKVVFDFTEGYKDFISTCKTERECVIKSIEIAKAHGFKDINYYIDGKIKLKPNDKVYYDNMGKSLALFIIG